MENRICRKCNKSLPITEFHKKSDNLGGLDFACKACHRERNKEYRAKRVPIQNEIDRPMCKCGRGTRAGIFGDEKCTLCKKEYMKKYHKVKSRWERMSAEAKQKENVRRRCRERLESKGYHKGACAVCGDKKTEIHHNDYNKPHDIVWLCRKHHAEWHYTNVAIGLSMGVDNG